MRVKADLSQNLLMYTVFKDSPLLYQPILMLSIIQI